MSGKCQVSSVAVINKHSFCSAILTGTDLGTVPFQQFAGQQGRCFSPATPTGDTVWEIPHTARSMPVNWE